MRRPRPILWCRRHWQLTDAVFAGVLAVVGVLSAWTERGSTQPGARTMDVWGLILVVASVAPLAVRRRWPIPVLWSCLVVQMVYSSLDYQGGWVGPMIAIYTVGAHTSTSQRLRHALAFGAVTCGFVLLGVINNVVEIGALIGTTVTLTASFLIGDNLRRRRERVAHLAERAERAERERDLLARDRVNEERTRIARELHDVVAHSVSVMVIQAAAARRQLTNDPAKAAFSLEVIEANGRQAMNEMRRVLGVLRSGIDPTGPGTVQMEPAPSMTDVGALVAADPFHLVTLHLDGSVNDLPPGVDLSAYRVVQEALTNVRKHAGPGARSTVEVSRTPHQLRIVVSDDGRGASTAADPTAPGYGLVGMRERVAMCGGALDAGPRRGGGWHVTATFPLVEFVAPAPVGEAAVDIATQPGGVPA